MPCNSDYMDATSKEVALSQVACLLDELDGKPIDCCHWNGYHPAVYNNRVNGDALVSRLCQRLQKEDVTKYSLEMQIWWRDHKAADQARIKAELAARKTESERQRALSKLTPRERKLLNL